MARRRPPLTEAPPPPARGVRASTFRLLLDTAMELIRRDGHIPSVAEVAVRCAVSRATAYRYFPTRSALITAVIEASLGPVRAFASDHAGGRERVHELFEQTFPRFTEFEPQLRAAAQLSLEQGALERAGLLEEEPYRRGHRIRILQHAIEPLTPQLPETVRERLHHALSIIYGIEPYIILKDIWGLPDREVERIALWMADALIDAALRDGVAASSAQASAPTPAPTPAPTSVPSAELAPMHSPDWYDAQYDNRARIAEHPAILQQWTDRSAAARAALDSHLDLAYGDAPAERLDLFVPRAAQRAPVLVYIHGGYWRALDKRDQSFVAAPFVDAGAIVVLPNHTLAPTATLAQIVMQLVQAMAWVHRNVARYGGDPARIVVAGHSAGGHLATMMLACRWDQVAPPTAGAEPLPARLVQAALAISGVFDLEPLRHAPFLSADLNLSAAEARRLSPAQMPAPTDGRLLAVVGADESEEFQRQHRLIGECWGPSVVSVCDPLPGRHHMNVLHDLAEPGAMLHALALDLLGLRR